MTSCLISSICELWNDRAEMEFRDDPTLGVERRSGSCAGCRADGGIFSNSTAPPSAAEGAASLGLK